MLASLSSTAQKTQENGNPPFPDSGNGHQTEQASDLQISSAGKEARQANEAAIGRPALDHLDAMLFRALSTWSSRLGRDLSVRCGSDHFGLCPTDIPDIPPGLRPLPLRRPSLPETAARLSALPHWCSSLEGGTHQGREHSVDEPLLKKREKCAAAVIFGHCQKINPRCASSLNWRTRHCQKPVLPAAETNVEVLRLRRTTRFANCSVTLRMTT